MSALKTIPVALDVSKELNAASFLFYRGDNVQFTYTFSGSGVNTASATKLRVIINPIVGGKVNTAEGRQFIAGEADVTDETFVISFTSGQTAVTAGNYKMAVILLDSAGEVVTTAAVPIRILDNGYTGIFTPSEDFRDEVMDALTAAEAARDAAQGHATTATTQAGVATTKAGIATTKAGEASEHAADALDSKNAAATSAQNAANSEGEAADSEQAAADAAFAAQEAQASAEAAAASLAGAVVFRGVTAAASAPSSPSNGDLWMIGVAGTWGGKTWAIGDYAVYVSASSTWGRIPLADLEAAERAARLNADFAKWAWIDFTSRRGICTNAPPPSAPLTMLFAYDLETPFSGSSTTMSFTTSRVSTGSAFYGLGFYLQGGSVVCGAGSNNATESSVSFAQTLFPAGRHAVALTVNNAWRGGTTGQLDTALYVDTPNVASSGTVLSSGATSFDFSGGNATLPLAIHVASSYASSTTASTVPLRISRIMRFNSVLPAARQSSGYSIEQFMAGEEPPASMMPVLWLESRQGNQWRNRISSTAHAVIEGAAYTLESPSVNVNTLTWAADGTAKAFLSSTNNVIPANCKITVSAMSTATVDIIVTDGAASPTTLITTQTLTANVWREVGTAFVATACKLAIDPASSITGSISVQVKIEPLT